MLLCTYIFSFLVILIFNLKEIYKQNIKKQNKAYEKNYKFF